MLYDIIFLKTSREPDKIWIQNPMVGDVIRTGLASDVDLEFWVIVSVNADKQLVVVEKI